MGRKLDAILGRSFKAYKVKAVASLAISRIAILKNQRQVRCNQTRSDVVQLLEKGHHDRALLRVEYLIKDQNMLDVYVMMEGYCNLMIERLDLIEQERVCPDELKEAISGLLYASTRCGEFPELQEIRAAFTSRYGKEFVASAIELRNHCRVHPKMIQKLSTRQPNMEGRMKVLKEIASEKNIIIEDSSSCNTEENLNVNKQNQAQKETSTSSGGTELFDDLQMSAEDLKRDGQSDSTHARKKYRDVADAAQAAFESAANAAAAARAAVELSRSGPHEPDNQNSHNGGRNRSLKGEPIQTESQFENQEIHQNNEVVKENAQGVAELKRLVSTSSTESDEILEVSETSFNSEDLTKQLEKDIVFDESDDESHNLHFNRELEGEIQTAEGSHKKNSKIIQSDPRVDSRHGYSTERAAEGPGIESSRHLNIEKRPISVRTRRVRGF
ncbi:REGULATOR OF VPS4 ACTIVITY IN THE MVB PATHWAY PROTEIN [Salix koriyanagi]|uniref:REGULATOR OF VPS4 ACTIVITY IN THE MVB PATHWAY PROTEIN n=1 Tax=Salix koriyanagi TaxID=2511006 RepID=A0A9Q0WT42_9ROSI|nr:REGULATOR OF VPS4 ACTIVITY IN THE MVB PATHWAY PROTEIN [Salix koriyanagi]